MFSLPRLLIAMSVPVLFFGQTQIELQQSKYTAPGAGAVNRSGASKLADVISVKDYGAAGDGVTDDLTAINNALSAASSKGQRILFPAGTYAVSGTVVVPSKTEIEGVGRGDASSINTVIKALPNFNGSTVVQMGTGPAANFGVQVKNMTIDGSGTVGICLSNFYSQDLSYGKDLMLTNCGAIALLISSASAQNSGPFENIEIHSGGGSAVTASSICAQVTGLTSFRGIKGITCDAGTGYATRPSVALALDGAGHYSDIHVQHFSTAVSLGSASLAADGVVIENAQFGPDVATGIAVTAPSGINNQDLTILGVSCVGCTSLLNDAELGTNITDSGLGSYLTGNGAGSGKSLLASSNGVGAKLYGPLQIAGNASFKAAPSTGISQVIEVGGPNQGSANLFEWHDQNDNPVAVVGSAGQILSGGFIANNSAMATGNGGAAFANNVGLWWSQDNTWYGTGDIGLARSSAGVLAITNGGAGLGSTTMQSLQLASAGAAQPACGNSNRGTFWFVQSASGTADHLQVCSKSASDAYAWVSVF